MDKTEMNVVENIKMHYIEKQPTQLDELKSLDKRVKRPANIFAYTYGSASSLVLGTGMCLAMKVLGAGTTFAMPLGIVLGVIGIGLTLSTYPIYKRILNKRKKKYSQQILDLSNRILND
ncbi:MAG: dihydropteridine reductase [Clostridiales bacterium]|nr:dihydropteridine reductase [Clostridiales bacterium]